MSRFASQLALVIGGGSGIGRATALRLAAEGAEVVVAGRSAGSLAETVAAIEAAGGKASARVLDVTRPEEVESLTSLAGLGIAINAFGYAPRATPIDRLDAEGFATILEVNYRGVFLATKAEAAAMSGGGAIINVASVLGLVGWAGQSAYAASKHAVVGLSQVMALELIHRGIRINAVCPGLVRSPMLARLVPKSLKTPGPDLTHAPDADAVALSIVGLVADRAIFGQAIELGANARRIG